MDLFPIVRPRPRDGGHLPIQIALTGTRTADWHEATGRHTVQLALLELRLTHPATRPTRTSQPFVRGDVPFLEPEARADVIAAAEPTGSRAGEVCRRLVQSQLVRVGIDGRHGPRQTPRNLGRGRIGIDAT